jgi:hypothetical protein
MRKDTMGRIREIGSRLGELELTPDEREWLIARIEGSTGPMGEMPYHAIPDYCLYQIARAILVGHL